MAKSKKKEPLKNYTLDELLQMTWDDINKMNARDLRHAVRTLNLVANKRIDRLTKAVNSNKPGVSDRGLYTGQGDLIDKFKISRKATVNEARNAFANVAHYLNRGTTTMAGAQKEFKRQAKQLGVDDIDNAEMKDLWSMYRTLDEQHLFTEEFDSERTQRKIGEMYMADQYTKQEIFNKVSKELKDAYRENQRKKTTTSQLARRRQSRSVGTAADLRDKIRGL